MKNKSITFAAFKPKNNILILECVVFFIATTLASYATKIGYQPLVDCCTSKVSDCSLARIGEDSLLHYSTLIFRSQMPKNNENYSSTNNSNANVTPNGAKTVSVATVQLQCNNPYSIACFEDFMSEAARHFDVECNAKNQAYSFILSRGLLNDFSDFCKMGSHSNNPHADCIAQLELLIPNEN